MDQNFISLRDVYKIQPYCDYMKKMCEIRDAEIKDGAQEDSVMNMLLTLLKRVNVVRIDVLEWLSIHYYADWQVMKSVFYFVSKSAPIDWFHLLEKIMMKCEGNCQYAALCFAECQKAFEYGIDVSYVTFFADKARNPHEFAIMISSAQDKSVDPLSAIMAESKGNHSDINEEENITYLAESIDFYKNQCIELQAEVESLNRYKMQQELMQLCKEEGSDDEELFEQQNEKIMNLEQENIWLRDEMSRQQETFQLKIQEIQEINEKLKKQDLVMETAIDEEQTEQVTQYNKKSILSKIKMRIQQKRFDVLPEMQQKEFILSNVIKNNIGDAEYIKLLKKLMDNSQISFSFIFSLVRNLAKKEELRNVLFLLEDENIDLAVQTSETNNLSEPNVSGSVPENVQEKILESEIEHFREKEKESALEEYWTKDDWEEEEDEEEDDE